MKTLEEHNRERMEHIQDYAAPTPNALACPDCNSVLWDSNPTLTLTSDPPQKNVHCPECGYKGYRIA